VTEAPRAVFLSYASQDAGAAQRICDALRSAGVEVWFDQSELRGGEAWDRQIRKQIHECALFIPVISVSAHARVEGYFRLEWKLAVDRSHLMAPDQTFLLPIVIDDTPQSDERIPDRFREMQWSRAPGGEVSAAFVRRVVQLLSLGPEHTPITVPQRGDSAARATPYTPVAAPTSRRSRLALLAIVIVLAAASVYLLADKLWLSRRSSPRVVAAGSGPSAEVPATAVAEKSIAVLPFADMSEKKDQEYFADGLAEELLDLLAKTPGLHVIARTSSFSFKGKSEDIPTIAAKLKVANILEGSVRKSGNRLRVTTQLVRAADGEHLWSETYDRELKDVFKVQDEIAEAVVTALKLKLAPAQGRSPSRSGNTDAYLQYLLGQQYYYRSTLEAYRRSIAAFRSAIALDSHYAAAYAGLAISEVHLADVTGESDYHQNRSSAFFVARRPALPGAAEEDRGAGVTARLRALSQRIVPAALPVLPGESCCSRSPDAWRAGSYRQF